MSDQVRLYKHDSPEQYRSAQIETNEAKRNNVWVTSAELEKVAEIVRNKRRDPTLGICHGVRTGKENKWLSEELGFRVIGTDISDREGVIEMDFHEHRAEWDGKADFVYSNSLDHSHSPEQALETWTKALKPGGLLMIEWSPASNNECDPADCFAAPYEIYVDMLSKHGNVETYKIKQTCHHDRERTLMVVEAG